MMSRLGLSAADLARLYSDLGDPAGEAVIYRRVRRRMKAGAEVPGEAVAFLNLLIRVNEAATVLGSSLPKETSHGRRRTHVAR
jgi:hypothetical protein